MAREAPFLTPRETAEMLTEAGLPVTDEAVRNWIKSDRIPSVELPSGRRFVRRAHVEAIIGGTPVPASAA